MFFSSLAAILVFGGLGIKYLMSLKKTWQLRITYEDSQEEQIRFLRHQQSLAIGDDIDCPVSEVRGYLKREGTNLYLEPISQSLPISYQGREITQRQLLKGNYIKLNCSYKSRDFNLIIQVNK